MTQTADFYLKVGDSNPPLTITCRYSDGTIQDLTGASVTFAMWFKTGVVKILDAAAAIVGAPTLGQAQYGDPWAAGDCNRVGDFEAEFHVTLPGGKKVTFPTGPRPENYIKIRIDPRIA